jgi:hypothetical protein
MNKFHVNIATDDEPYDAKTYCQNILRANRVLDRPKHILENGSGTQLLVFHLRTINH